MGTTLTLFVRMVMWSGDLEVAGSRSEVAVRSGAVKSGSASFHVNGSSVDPARG